VPFTAAVVKSTASFTSSTAVVVKLTLFLTFPNPDNRVAKFTVNALFISLRNCSIVLFTAFMPRSVT
jgi:hypothetical protein